MRHQASHRRRRPLAVLAVSVVAVVVVVGGCSTGEDPDAAVDARSTPTSTSSAPAPTPTSSAPKSPTQRPAPSGDRGPGPDGVTITVPPAGVEAGPAVVLVHGGAWVAGAPNLLNELASALAAEGAVVFNASYRLVGQGGGDPGSVDDVACAVRFARAEAPAYTDSDQLVIVGHSAGGHLAAVVALDPEPWGGDCAYPPADPPDRLVGLAGVYDVKVPFISTIFAPFVGASLSSAPERWSAVNPVELAAGQDGLDVVLVTGSADQLVPSSQATEFAAALPDGADLLEIDGATHNDLMSPDVVDVDVILEK